MMHYNINATVCCRAWCRVSVCWNVWELSWLHQAITQCVIECFDNTNSVFKACYNCLALQCKSSPDSEIFQIFCGKDMKNRAKRCPPWLGGFVVCCFCQQLLIAGSLPYHWQKSLCLSHKRSSINFPTFTSKEYINKKQSSLVLGSCRNNNI